jgi:GTPase SAR1 family protein
MFELKREVLFTELLTQMQSGSVLITGAPGIGKSWLIGRLLGHLKPPPNLARSLFERSNDITRECSIPYSQKGGKKVSIPVPFWSHPPHEIGLKLTKRHENSRKSHTCG